MNKRLGLNLLTQESDFVRTSRGSPRGFSTGDIAEIEDRLQPGQGTLNGMPRASDGTSYDSEYRHFRGDKEDHDAEM